MPGLTGPSLGGELPLDPFFFFWFFGVVEEGELLEDEWEGFTACCCELFGPLLFPLAFFLGSLDVFHCFFLFGWTHTFEYCDLYYLEELPVHLRMETGLCSAALTVGCG